MSIAARLFIELRISYCPRVRNRSAYVLAKLGSMVITQGNHVNVTWWTDLPSDVNLAENLCNWTAMFSG
jgi:hypothetical protein